MEIESLNSVMAFQTQPILRKQENTVVVSEENKEEVMREVPLTTDKNTSIVQKSENKEEHKDPLSEQNKHNQQKSTERMKKAVEQMNENLQNSEAIFGIHEKTNRVTIKIVDKETKEVLREIPPEKTLDMIAKIWEMAGILVDEKR